MIFLNDTFEVLDSPSYVARQISASSFMGAMSVLILSVILFFGLKLMAVVSPGFQPIELGLWINIGAGVSFCLAMALPYLAPKLFLLLMFPNFAEAWKRRHGTYSPNL